tara:strand:- start:732 stop:1376 length:645 start_codon:yes stop_codon:yes gene_type:complete
MTVIFPGNYVTQLNAYRDQGVVALPGVEFYRLVGALVLNPDTDSVTTTAGVLNAGDYQPQILSPDLRQDDKPRLDKLMTIPANAVVYRTSVSAPGVKANASADTIKIKALGANAPGNTGSETTLTAGSDKFFPANGVSSVLTSIIDGTAISTSAVTNVEVTTSAAFTAELKDSAGAGRNAPSAIIVEVCYYIPAPAPGYDDVSIPYAIEAGQGT